MICIGHGLGGYIHCHLASTGIKPAAFIFASGVFSDYEVILSQKYIPINQIEEYSAGNPEKYTDTTSLLIAKKIGTLLQAARKGKPRVHIELGENRLDLQLEPRIFNGNQMPRYMFRFVISPTLIIHGSADQDISLWNAASIEQSIRKNTSNIERVILADRDHWFRTMPDNPGDRLMERLNGGCFKRETDVRVFKESVSFLRRVLKS